MSPTYRKRLLAALTRAADAGGRAATTGTIREALSVALLSGAVAALGIGAGHPHYEGRSAAVYGLMSAMAPKDGVEGAAASDIRGRGVG